MSGDLGIMPGHLPLITKIHPGFVRMRFPGKDEVERVFVAGGILEVQPHMVTVLADTAVRSKDMDEAKAQAALEARQSATGQIEIARIEAEIAALAAELATIKRMRRKR